MFVGRRDVHARHPERARTKAVTALVAQRLLQHRQCPRRVDDTHAGGILTRVAVPLEIEPRPISHQVELMLEPDIK